MDARPHVRSRPPGIRHGLKIGLRFSAAVLFAFCLLHASAHAQTPILALYNVPPDQYAFVKKLNLNAVITGSETVQLDRAHALGLRAMVNMWPGHFTDSRAWQNRIRLLKSHPALSAWIIYDEPDLNRKSLAEVALSYRTLKSIDTVHPVYQTIWNPLRYAEFSPYCDILAVVPYVVTKKEPLNGDDMMRIHQSITLAKKVMKGKPVYTVIQSFAGHPTWPRTPTPSELLSMVAVAKAAGTDGYAFYAYASAERYPTPTSPTGFHLYEDTPLMNAVRSSASLLLR